MAQKINPKSYRLGVINKWDSRWFPKKKTLPVVLEEDFKVRQYLSKKLKSAGVENIIIERLGNNLNVNISTARPGLVIGRGGKGVEDLKKDLDKIIAKHRREKKIEGKSVLSLNIEEVKFPFSSAQVVAGMIAEDLEKRMPFRRAMKKMIEQVMKEKGVEGVKIRVGGRLGGTDIARSEWLSQGRMPLQTLRANIDYAQARAVDPYGTMGVKVWIYKGQVFEGEKQDINKGLGEILKPKGL